MTSILALAAAFVIVVLAVAVAGRALGRPIPRALLFAFALAPILVFPESFAGRTILPLDQSVPPWTQAGAAPGYNQNLNDVLLQFLPWTRAVRMAWAAGELPLRDRWNGCGAPLAANGQSGAFSPFTLAGLALPLVSAFTLSVMAKLFLALTGMWLWCRELGRSKLSALFASMLFAFSFSMTPWLLFPHTAVLCLWPWMLFLVELLRDRARRSRAAVALTACFAAMFLAGHPETLALGCLFAGLWVAGRWAARALPDGPAVLARTASCGLMACGLVAWLLLPQLAAIRASNRYVGLEHLPLDRVLSALPHAPIWGAGLVAPFFPFTFGDGISSPPIPGGSSAFPEVSLAYIGILGWAIALLMFRPGSGRRREEWVLLALAVAGIAAATGVWPATELVTRLPLLRVMSPLRYFSWAALAAPVMAALELDRYREDAAAGGRPWIALVASCAALALAAAAVFARHRDLHALAGGIGFQRRELVLVGAALAVTAFGAMLSRRRATALAILIIGLAAGELALGARHLYRFEPADALFRQTPLVRFLRERPGTFRVVGEGPALFPSTNVFAGVEDARTHDPVEPRAYLEFLDAAAGYPPNDYFRWIAHLNASAFDFLNVRYVVTGPGRPSPGPKWTPAYTGPDGSVFENAAALPRVFAPRRVRFDGAIPTPVREIARTRDWTAVGFLAAGGSGEAENGPVEVDSYREDVNRATFRTKSAAPAFVFASLSYGGAWVARDETGVPLPIVAANHAFLAVRVPAGEHAITLHYSPPGFLAGGWIALASLGVSALALILRRRPPRIPG